ncbi:MAG: TIGR01212 family radical SAM protein, partial [Kiritimatiellae bacterium]|nr:TIGR01212 family radical SAM protein [Kiritimatiellia bacterium]
RGCPHRDLSGSGGCAFCPEHGARAVQTMNSETITEQVSAALHFARRRYLARRYMLYFQAFTSTHELDAATRGLFERVRGMASFDAISIGTRPDCLSESTLDFLASWAETTDVWVELGIQTVHDATLRRINRGHDYAATERAVAALHARGIPIAAHVILGLPGEEQAHFNSTAETLAALPIEAIKIHNLHVIKKTSLADEYAVHPFPVYQEYAYGEMLLAFLRRIPRAWPIIRMTTDTPPEELVAPLWHMPKGRFIEYIQQQMILREWRQGDLVPGGASGEALAPAAPEAVITGDGSTTLWNDDFKEHYHTQAGARLEAEKKYVQPVELDQRLADGPVALLDICFGLGYNTLVACNLAEQLKHYPLHVTALELDRRVLLQAAAVMPKEASDAFLWSARLRALHDSGGSDAAFSTIRLWLGDARHTLRAVPSASQDIVFLDAFSTQRNSELWTLDFFRLIRAAMKPDAVLVTYCAALPVRAGLMQAGFSIGETEPVGRQRSGTLASPDPNQIRLPIGPDELKTIRETPRGMPYRDPWLIWTNRDILRERQQSGFG